MDIGLRKTKSQGKRAVGCRRQESTSTAAPSDFFSVTKIHRWVDSATIYPFGGFGKLGNVPR